MKFEGKIISLNVEDILPNRFQPRITFMENHINELAESIKSYGVIQPIVVRKIGVDKYEIIAGERRYKANLIAGNDTIPAIITELDDNDSAEIALIENIQREDLTAIEEAVSYKKLLDMGRLKQDDLAQKLGKKQSTVSNKLRLLNLEEEVQEALLEKRISERHARSLLKLNGSDQRKMLDKILTERLTVRKTDLEIEKLVKKPEEEIEVLDFSSSKQIEKEEEKGKNDMNQENFGFNIPTTPIIEDNNSTGISANSETKIMPGFMDVNKIEETATDINVEKPVANIDSLLESKPVYTNNATAPASDTSIFGFTPNDPVKQEKNSQPEENKQTGRFFDLGNITEENNLTDMTSIPTTIIPETIIEEVPISQGIENLNNMFSADKKIEEKVEEEIIIEKEPESIFNFSTTPKNPDFIEDVEKVETNMNFNIPTIEPAKIPTLETETNILEKSNIDNNILSQQEVVNETIVPQPVMPEVKLENNFIPSSIVQPEPLAESMQIEPVQSVPTQKVMPSYSIPDTSELDDFLNSLDDNTPISGLMNESAPETVLETNVTDTINMAPVDSEKMSKIKSIIAEAKDKIAALGVRVEIDEFDFDDMYQAIIKLDK